MNCILQGLFEQCLKTVHPLHSARKPHFLHQYKPCSKLRTWRRHSTHPGLPLSERIVRLVKPSRGSTSSIAAVAHVQLGQLCSQMYYKQRANFLAAFMQLTFSIVLEVSPWLFSAGQRLRDLEFLAPTHFLPFSTSSTHLGIGSFRYIPLWR